MTLNDLKGFEHEYRGSSGDIWNEVMDSWLVKGEECGYPASWEGLYELLRDLDLAQVASQLEKAVKQHC